MIWLKGARELIRFWFEASVIALVFALLLLWKINPSWLWAFILGNLAGAYTLFRMHPAYWLHPPIAYFEEQEEAEAMAAPPSGEECFEPIATLHRAPILESSEFVVRRLDGRDQFLRSCDQTTTCFTSDLSDAHLFADWLTAWDTANHCYVLCDREYSFVVVAIAPALELEAAGATFADD